MYVATIPNRGSPPAILLRESYREAGKTKNRTLANLSNWPSDRIVLFRAVLRGDKLAPIGSRGFEIRCALPHGHVLAALTTARRIGLEDLLPRRAPQRRRDLALALIVARMLDPAAKLATARRLDSATASHSLGEVLGPRPCRRARDLHHARLAQQRAELHRSRPCAPPSQGRRALVLYDVTSTYLEGRYCPLAPPRLQPRQPLRSAATGDRTTVRRRRLSDRGRGV
jgi:hypothetical protein